MCTSETTRIINSMIDSNVPIKYVYMIKEIHSNKRYIGKRTAIASRENDPRRDLGVVYFTSSNDTTFKSNLKSYPDKFVGVILLVTDCNDAASEYEYNILSKYDAVRNSKFFNMHNATLGRDTSGVVPVIDIHTNNNVIVSSECYRKHKGKLYRHSLLGTITVKDKVLGSHQRISLEEYTNNKHLYDHHMNSRLWVYDKVSNCNKWIDSSEYATNSHLYIKHSSGKIVVTTNDNTTVMIGRQEFNSDIHTNINTGTMTVLNKSTNSYIKIKSQDYDKRLHSTHSTGKVYVNDTNGKSTTVSVDEYSENKDLYSLRKSNRLGVFNISTNARESIDSLAFDNRIHITLRTRLIKLFMDGVLIDIFTHSGVYSRYKKPNAINASILIKSYKSKTEFVIGANTFIAIKQNILTDEDIVEYLKFNTLSL